MHIKTELQKQAEYAVLGSSEYLLAKEFAEMYERACKNSPLKYEGYSISHSETNERGKVIAVYFTVYFSNRGKEKSRHSHTYKSANKTIFQSIHSFEKIMTEYQLKKIKKTVR